MGLSLMRRWFVSAIAILLVSVASHAAFWVGQTAQGVSPASCPDSVPALAAGMGMNICAFADALTSSTTTDTQGTNNAGYNWYTQNSPCTVWFHATITSNTTLAISSLDAQAGCDATVGAATPQLGMTVGQGGTPGVPAAGTTITACPRRNCGGEGNYNLSTSHVH